VDIGIFEQRESNVRSYCRHFPAVFASAKNALLYDETGKRYIDFLAGAGSLNFGHNNEFIMQRLRSYLADNGLVLGLDLYTTAKREFLRTFIDLILDPRHLPYKVQFCGPTGTNAVEAALKLARNTKQRSSILAFMGGYHGLSLGSLATTGNRALRDAAGVPLSNVVFLPYPSTSDAGHYRHSFDTLAYLEMVLQDPLSGVDKPAAIIVETIQAEGGVVVAPTEWLKGLRDLCTRHDILLICDDIQTGCGRTGTFFSFERAAIVPDIVTLSKSISGSGLPMSLVLIHPDIDTWNPGEHAGTFRGNQLAYVTATAALQYWMHTGLEESVRGKTSHLRKLVEETIGPLSAKIQTRGLGMMWGIDLEAFGDPGIADRVARRCFDQGLIVETVGRHGGVLKLIPPLITEMDLLTEGCNIIKRSIETELDEMPGTGTGVSITVRSALSEDGHDSRR